MRVWHISRKSVTSVTDTIFHEFHQSHDRFVTPNVTLTESKSVTKKCYKPGSFVGIKGIGLEMDHTHDASSHPFNLRGFYFALVGNLPQ